MNETNILYLALGIGVFILALLALVLFPKLRMKMTGMGLRAELEGERPQGGSDGAGEVGESGNQVHTRVTGGVEGSTVATAGGSIHISGTNQGDHSTKAK